jgi:hypothetical protein
MGGVRTMKDRKMFRFRSVALVIFLLAGACGDAGTPTPQAAKAGKAEDNPAHQQLLTARPVDRMLALRRAIQDDEGSCNKVTGSAYQQQYKGMAMWVAFCSSGPWAVYVAPSGDIQARPCKDSATLGLPECRVPPPESGKDEIWPANARPLAPAPGR